MPVSDGDAQPLTTKQGRNKKICMILCYMPCMILTLVLCGEANQFTQQGLGDSGDWSFLDDDDGGFGSCFDLYGCQTSPDPPPAPSVPPPADPPPPTNPGGLFRASTPQWGADSKSAGATRRAHNGLALFLGCLALVLGHAFGIIGLLHAGPGLFALLVIWLPLLAFQTWTFFKPGKVCAPPCSSHMQPHRFAAAAVPPCRRRRIEVEGVVYRGLPTYLPTAITRPCLTASPVGRCAGGGSVQRAQRIVHLVHDKVLVHHDMWLHQVL